jgi:hypothetical protein
MERSWPQTDRRLLNIDLVRMKMHLKALEIRLIDRDLIRDFPLIFTCAVVIRHFVGTYFVRDFSI